MLNILQGKSWLSQAASMSQPRSTKGLSLQEKILQHLMKRQITSLPNKLSCVQKSILVLQWLLQTTKMCLSCSSFIVWINDLLVQYLWSHRFRKDHLSTLTPLYKPTKVSYLVYQQPISYPGETLYLHTSGLAKELSWRIWLLPQLAVAVWLPRCAVIWRRWPGNKVYRCLLKQPSRQGDDVRYHIQDLENKVWKYSNFIP